MLIVWRGSNKSGAGREVDKIGTEQGVLNETLNHEKQFKQTFGGRGRHKIVQNSSGK